MGTSYWTGVPLRVILNKCGIKKPTESAKFVNFSGPKGTHTPARRRSSSGRLVFSDNIRKLRTIRKDCKV